MSGKKFDTAYTPQKNKDVKAVSNIIQLKFQKNVLSQVINIDDG
jgi:hypothetical protein